MIIDLTYIKVNPMTAYHIYTKSTYITIVVYESRLWDLTYYLQIMLQGKRLLDMMFISQRLPKYNYVTLMHNHYAQNGILNIKYDSFLDRVYAE